MFHPLLSDPSTLKDLDLEAKLLDLSKKYHIAARMGNGDVCDQILMALNMYKGEQQRRQFESSMKLIQKQQDSGLDDLININ